MVVERFDDLTTYKAVSDDTVKTIEFFIYVYCSINDICLAAMRPYNEKIPVQIIAEVHNLYICIAVCIIHLRLNPLSLR